MKRDLDLARQLLLDIENRGADCSVSVLRSEPEQHTEERVRYHLRLLIDADLLKEIDRTSSGIPCVRLTHEGHELLELARNESRWREAKWTCQDRIGGLSLSVIRGILLRWALGSTHRSPRPRRVVASRPARYEPETILERPAYRVESHSLEAHPLENRSYWEEDDVRYVRVRAENGEYRELSADEFSARRGIDLDGDGVADLAYESSLPAYLI
ncbi:MAG: DUF2513 domain-containing protein [Planctomycetes bacterium]|nr:DUF2513 domain-containing protein [Planctomycetota bacterium]